MLPVSHASSFLRRRPQKLCLVVCLVPIFYCPTVSPADHVRQMQLQAEETEQADWGHWGADPQKYRGWGNHSNRLIPVYTFGIDLDKYRGANSPYRDAGRLKQIFGAVPKQTVNPNAEYFDQTDLCRLQWDALKSGKKNIVLILFDGMDWPTTWAAAIVASRQVGYTSGRGTGLSFQDYDGVMTDFGYMVTSPYGDGGATDVDAQRVLDPDGQPQGGYVASLGGATPWATPSAHDYLLGKLRSMPHSVTDSACSATSINAGIKTYNSAINVDPHGRQVEPIARVLQEQGWKIGVVSSVPISHATSAATYANNVSRNDYQDLTRDLIGLPSIAHRRNPLPGVDVLLGCGWGEESDNDGGQGSNFVPGNVYITQADLKAIDVERGGKYRVVQRTQGKSGRDTLMAAARQAYTQRTRLFGLFGVTAGNGRKGGHLPYQTADGAFNPTQEKYGSGDVEENPTLAEMTQAALGMLSASQRGFWLMIEAGDVDWANHSNNVDDAIGAVLSGDAAYRMVVRFLEKRNAWQDTIVIVTADHGHYLVLEDPAALIADPARVAESRN